MWFSKRTKGVISVFLILIIVPVMVLSALLVDASRMVSARTMTQEAADLAALSVLSEYNEELKNQFGLLALEDNSRAEEIFKDSLNNTLQVYGLDKQTYSEQIWNLLKHSVSGGTDYSTKSFMNLYDFRVHQSSVTPMYSLANPEVLQNQIVEYSKYRGLYVLAERLDLLTKTGDLKKEGENQKQAAAVMDEKMEIDEKNAEVDNVLQKIWEDTNEANENLEKLDQLKEKYMISLSARMELAEKEHKEEEEDEEDDEELKRKAESFHDDQKLLKEAFATIADCGKRIKSNAKQAQVLTEQNLERLNEFQKSHQGEAADNEAIKELMNDTELNIEMYRDYYQKDLQKLLDDKNLKVISEEGFKGVSEDTFEKIEDVSEGTENDKGRFGFQTYDSKGELVRNAHGDPRLSAHSTALKSYEGMVNKICRLSGRKKILSINPSEEFCNRNGKVQGTISRNTAKKQSGPQSLIESENKEKRHKLNKEVYKSRPSKTFKPQNGKNTSASKVNSDNGKISLSFYNEDKDLNGTRNALGSGQDNLLVQLAETTRDEALTFSYIFGTFKTRLSSNSSFTSSNKPKEIKPYTVNWRYLYEDGEHNMRFLAKTAEETPLRSQVEYILFGKDSDAANEDLVYATIMASRLSNNMVALYCNETVKTTCDLSASATSAAVSLTGIMIPPTVFFWIYLTAWAAAETTIEMEYLVKYGYKIPLIKTKNNILLTATIGGSQPGLIGHYYAHGESKPYVSYEDYLLLLLLIFTDSKTRLMRTADLIEMEMRRKDKDFRMENANTFIQADTEISIRYLFGAAPVFAEEYQDYGITGRMGFLSSIQQGY